MQNIGLAIYNWRMKEGLTARDAGNWIGISDQTIKNLERGRVQPSQKTLRKIQKCLGDLGELDTKPTEEATYVPFTERLAAMYPEKQKQFDEEAKAQAAPNDADRSDIARIIGYFEGVAAATGVKMCDNIGKLEHILTKYDLL